MAEPGRKVNKGRHGAALTLVSTPQLPASVATSDGGRSDSDPLLFWTEHPSKPIQIDLRGFATGVTEKDLKGNAKSQWTGDFTGRPESGPCTKKVGRPEPSRCRWGCDHRLEEAYLRDDIDRSIAEAVRLYELEVADDNEMGQEFWAGQILAHLRRFDDIYRKWAPNSTVMQVVRKEELAA